MLHKVDASDSRFKPAIFLPGPNCILAERTETSEDVDTRNGAGKSSTIEVINYLLGGNNERDGIFRFEDVGDFWYGLELDIGGERRSARRTPTQNSKVYIESAAPLNGKQPSRDRDLGEYYFSADDWKEIIGEAYFRLNSTHDAAPSYRQMLPFFLRRERKGGYRHPNRYDEKMADVDATHALAYLLGLDYDLVHAWAKLKQDEQELRELKKAAKGSVMSSIIESTAKLRPRLLDAESRVVELRRRITEFRVLDAYANVVDQAATLKRRLEDLARGNLVDEQRIQRLQAALSDERPPSFEDVEALFSEASVVFPDIVRASYDEYTAFHRSIVANRRAHLESELRAAHARLAERLSESTSLDSERSEMLQLLRTHGALEEFVLLQEQLAKEEAAYQDFRRRYDAALAFERTSVTMRERRAELVRAMFESLSARRDVIEVLTRDYSELVAEFYGDRAASLEISASDKGLQIQASIQGDRSPGIGGIEIFCFDMMVMRAVRRRQLGIDWLVHDSHLFSDSDNRHVSKALSVAARESRTRGFQYIVMLNTDQLMDIREKIDHERYHVALELTDTATGGLFGRRF